jgi:membrane associated rhomboid family serine protease
MIPVKDNIPRERFPLVTALLVAIELLAYLLSDHDGLLPLLLNAIFLGLMGPGVEGALGRARFCVLCLLSGVLAGAAWALLGGAGATPVLVGSTGATVVVLGGYLLLYPRARVLTLVPVPFYTTLVEVPATLTIGVWLALQIGFGAAGLG